MVNTRRTRLTSLPSDGHDTSVTESVYGSNPGPEATNESNPMAELTAMLKAQVERNDELMNLLLEERKVRSEEDAARGGDVLIRGETPGGGPQPAGTLVGCSYKSFMACRPPTFEGSLDPNVCMRWIREIEKKFRVSKCSDADRVNYGTSMLEGNALCWWEGLLPSIGEDVLVRMLWEQFKVKFMERYVPTDMENVMEHEFMSLVQGESMTVDEFDILFEEKARFAPYLVMTAKRRVDRFFEKLKKSIREFIGNREYSTKEEVLRCARAREREMRRPGDVRPLTAVPVSFVPGSTSSFGARPAIGGPFVEKRKFLGPPRPFSGNKRGGAFGSNFKRPEPVREAPSCPLCKTKHFGRCTKGVVKCYNCGKDGHTARDCSSKDWACFSCGKPGHFSRECPRRW